MQHTEQDEGGDCGDADDTVASQRARPDQRRGAGNRQNDGGTDHERLLAQVLAPGHAVQLHAAQLRHLVEHGPVQIELSDQTGTAHDQRHGQSDPRSRAGQ